MRLTTTSHGSAAPLTPTVSRRSSGWTSALVGGVVAGTIDIGAACLIYRSSMPFILHSIAGGLLGKQSFDGGFSTALLGLALQESMSILIAAIYFLVMQTAIGRMRTWQWWESGTLFGAGVFVVMNYVVVPLSAWHRFPHWTSAVFVENLLAMVLFGLIIAYCARPQSSRDGT
jgi:hypothetical protein